jgi:hypothetical protein
VSGILVPEDYTPWLTALKSRIQAARAQAVLAAQAELVRLYRQIGTEILTRQEREGWGAKVIGRLSADLSDAFPEMRRRAIRPTSEKRPTSNLVARSATAIVAQRRARRAVFGLTVLMGSLLAELTARAELELRWNAPQDCPQREAVENRIRALAGPLLAQTKGLSAEGSITRAEGRFNLTLLVRDGSEVRKRVITSDSCATLEGAAAITLALLLDAEVRAESPADDQKGTTNEKDAAPRDGEPRGRSDRVAEPRPASPPVAAVAGGASAPPRRWAALVRGPTVVADLGPLPSPTIGVGLGLGIRYQSFRVMLSGSYFAEQTVSVPDQGDALGAELKRMTGQLTVCRGWRSIRFEVSPCVGLALEIMTARGFGNGVTASQQWTVWPAPSAGVIAHWHTLQAVGLFAGVSVSIELSRPHVAIEGVGEVAQLGPAAVGAAAGLEWSF